MVSEFKHSADGDVTVRTDQHDGNGKLVCSLERDFVADGDDTYCWISLEIRSSPYDVEFSIYSAEEAITLADKLRLAAESLENEKNNDKIGDGADE